MLNLDYIGAIPLAKLTTEKPLLAPLELSKEKEEELVSQKAKRKKQMAQFAKLKFLID